MIGGFFPSWRTCYTIKEKAEYIKFIVVVALAMVFIYPFYTLYRKIKKAF